jgi:hypothetical protein
MLYVEVEALVWSEKRAVSIDTLNSSHCLSQLATQFSRAASPADGHTHLHHTRQQLPAPPARRQRASSSMTTPPLRPADARAAGKGITRRGRRRTTQARSTARLRSWRCRWAPFALCLQAAPSAHQSGHAHTHPDAICAAPRSPPPALSCEPEGRTTIVACFLACARRTPAAAATAIGSEFMKIMLSFASHLY